MRQIVLQDGSGEICISLFPSLGYDVAVQSHRGALGFAFDGQAGWHAFGSDKLVPFARRPNTLAWVPPGCEVKSRSRAGGEYLLIEGIAPAVSGLAVERMFNDVLHLDAIAAAGHLRRVLISDSTGSLAVIKQAANILIAIAEARLTGSFVARDRRLTTARLHTLDALIDARLEQGLTVAAMAEALGLSLGYFMRTARASLGVTPHAYLMHRRLARARRGLAAGQSIAEVAAACGFSHQSHLTRVMGRQLGTTPAGRPITARSRRKPDETGALTPRDEDRRAMPDAEQSIQRWQSRLCAGVETALLSELDFESSASTNSTTPAHHGRPPQPRQNLDLHRIGRV